MTSCSPFSVLLVEDDAVDARAVRRAFKKRGLDLPLVVVRDGIEALARLRGTDGLPAMSAPVLVLLDLNLPRMNGHEFLDALRKDPMRCDTMVVVLSTSTHEDDLARAQARGVALYIIKAELTEQLPQLIDLMTVST